MNSKLCTKCNQIKTTDQFYNRTDKSQKWCKSCKNDYDYERWFRRKVKAVAYLGNVCADCGKTYPVPIYDFHHRDPETKLGTWSKMRLWSWKKVLIELDKCELLCANCHRLRHSRQYLLYQS